MFKNKDKPFIHENMEMVQPIVDKNKRESALRRWYFATPDFYVWIDPYLVLRNGVIGLGIGCICVALYQKYGDQWKAKFKQLLCFCKNKNCRQKIMIDTLQTLS